MLAFLSIFVILETLDAETGIGIDSLVIILFGVALWHSLSEIKEDWTKKRIKKEKQKGNKADMTNYYELLEVSPNASVEVIRAAYKAGIKRYHPDNYTDAKEKDWATERIKLLNEAVAVLTDEKSRQEYDQELAEEAHFFRKDGQGGNYHNTEDFGNYGHSGGNDTRSYDTGSNFANDMTTYVEGLIVRCKDEVAYLELHDNILKGGHSETEKRQSLEILDNFTKVRLQQELEDEAKIEDYRSEVKSMKWGIVFWVAIGILFTPKYWWAFWAGIVLGILLYCDSKKDRDNLARAEYAVKHLSIYRMRGFKI